MAKIATTSATLRVTGDDLDPAVISNMLGCQPDSSRRKGEQMMELGVRSTARTGMWSIAAGERKPGDLNQQVAELLARLSADSEVWRALRERYRIDLFCGFFLKDSNEGLSLSPETMSELASRGILLDLDIYYTGTSAV